MTTTVPALTTAGPNQPFRRGTVERRDPRPHDVVVDIAYSGICHSDIHQARDEWGEGIYPMVPGHEISGIVAAVGSEVDRYAVGDRVGVGCFVDSCRRCESCLAGEEQYCLEGEVQTYNSRAYDGSLTYGGYSTQIVVDQNYVLRIPDGIALDAAAPLLCAGITLYSPLVRWGAGPGRKVAVLGMGGLGHLGVKLAKAMGAEVTVLSRTLAKEADGRRLGADHYHATGDPRTFTELAGRFDLIVNTVAAEIPVEDYLRLLDLEGTMITVGVPRGELGYHGFSQVTGRGNPAGSKIGGIRQTQEMLDFCARHGLGADIETISCDDVDDAWDRVVKGDVRYRFVIDAASFA
ncbi:NAD(P)-dependent alcohol dehydrogenase [Pseudonocardia sp. HH130630-07]|uniref:NAD(P)-dependent alcohol dehydrogenase n=1 Tax=Pseudonocardia sp. HH130630-07 TaxID=1690815 RepID=UPI000814BB6F|nr:NAD(P)-dependent alcohol dehydrogenase [Pseudonocardia sp. HH130630-07]ANY06966.1 alcohol dehydrogenase [Pseudonocardia sp. HH130630-07]